MSYLSNQRSYEWTAQDMEIRGFRLVDEERVGSANSSGTRVKNKER